MDNYSKKLIFKNQQIYIISAGFALAILAIILFFIYPCFNGIKNSSKELALNKISQLFLEDQVNEVEKFKSKYEEYRPNLEKIDNLYIDSKNPADFFEFFENTEKASRVESEINIVLNEKSLDSISFQVFSQGELSKVIKFLEKLETGPYLIEIQNLLVKSSLEQKSVIANFLIKAYVEQ